MLPCFSLPFSRSRTQAVFHWWSEENGGAIVSDERVRNRPKEHSILLLNSFTVLLLNGPLKDIADSRQTQPYDVARASGDHEVDVGA